MNLIFGYISNRKKLITFNRSLRNNVNNELKQDVEPDPTYGIGSAFLLGVSPLLAVRWIGWQID
jgi:hypothetical protein